MSLTVATIISEIFPKHKILLIEKMSKCAQESSMGINNAGTGHAGYCELNYTPMNKRNQINIDRAVKINEMFEISLQFWAYLNDKYKFFNVSKFLNKVPHISFVMGKKNVNFLKRRYINLKKQPLFREIQYTEDSQEIKKWAPLLMKGRSNNQDVAATKIEHGTDINFGELCNQLLKILKKNKNFALKLNSEVFSIDQSPDSSFNIKYRNHLEGNENYIKSSKVFIGAGGMSINLLQKLGIKQIKGYAGYPLSGDWLVCKKNEVLKSHQAKVYGQAFPGAPAMSIPHLDLRIIDDKKIILFGPFASFTTKFLKHGSRWDFIKSIKFNNIYSILAIFLKNLPLLRYLVKQSMMTHEKKMEQLRAFFPNANSNDWKTMKAGKRVQIIKNTKEGVKLEFGTEILYSEDKSLAGLIGASPGASTSCYLMLNVLLNIYSDKNLQRKIRKIIPAYNIKLNENPGILKKMRTKVHKELNLS
jgi:malate dehydrogenase (quinone)